MKHQAGLLRYYASRAYNKSLRITGRVPRVSEGVLKKDLVVLSAGYNGNLGDQAIAYCVARQCLDHGLHPFFVDYNDIQDRNAVDANLPALMFGGELGDLFHFTALKTQQPRPLRAAIGGISISNTFTSSQDPELLSYLKQVQAFFVRDKSVAKKLQTFPWPYKYTTCARYCFLICRYACQAYQP